MANPKPGPGKRFKKGNKANPLGAGAHNKELKSIRRLSQEDIAEIGNLILEGNLDKLKEVRSNPASTVLKVWICSVAINAINKGDPSALNVLLDRIVGKVKDNISLSGNINQNIAHVDISQLKGLRDKFDDEY
jgi:hypothetical protein